MDSGLAAAVAIGSATAVARPDTMVPGLPWQGVGGIVNSIAAGVGPTGIVFAGTPGHGVNVNSLLTCLLGRQ